MVRELGCQTRKSRLEIKRFERLFLGSQRKLTALVKKQKCCISAFNCIGNEDENSYHFSISETPSPLFTLNSSLIFLANGKHPRCLKRFCFTVDVAIFIMRVYFRVAVMAQWWERSPMWPRLDSGPVSYGGEFVVGSRLASRVFLRVLRFSSFHKHQHSKFQFEQERGPTWRPAKADVVPL